jgi:hypothetical protein
MPLTQESGGGERLQPLVSVITPVFNERSTLSEPVERVESLH